MASEKQITANRMNARKSTGPISDEGKAIVSMNALRHGMLSTKLLLANEDRSEFDQFASEILVGFQPEGEFERLLVDRIIASAWRLRRIIEIDTLLLQWDRQYESQSEIELQREFYRYTDTFIALSRYEVGIEKSLYRALHELERVQSKRKEIGVSIPIAIDVNSESRCDE